MSSEEAAGAADPSGDAILELVPDGILVVTDGSRIEWMNQVAADLFGVEAEQAIGSPFGDVIRLRDAAGRDVADRIPVGRRVPLAKGLPERDFEIVHPTAGYIPVAMHCTYDKDDDEVVRRVVCTLRDARPRRGMDMRTVEIISTVSHEIRSPLTSIKGFTKTLLDRWDRFDDDIKREMLAAANSDADRVTRLLGELLDISRLEAGRLKLRQDTLDVAALVEKVLEKLRPHSTQHDLRVDVPSDLPRAFADRDKVQQVLTNLIENAIKYTDHGTVTVTASRNGRWIEVAVSDEGEGIPEPQLKRLFRKFYRRERAGSPSGTGLGLYICRGLIEAHGGEIDVRSVEGEGSVFSFTLPVRPDA